MPSVYEDTTKYTIVFDLFREQDLLDSNTETSTKYIQTLIDKDIILLANTKLKHSDWIESVWENKDIFVEKSEKEPLKAINSIKWFNKYKPNKDTEKRNFLIDYRFSAIELTPIDIRPATTKFLEMNNVNGNGNEANNFMSSGINTRPFINDKLCAEVLGYGVVRLFKDSENHLNMFKIDTPGMKHVAGDDTTVAILAVPFYFSASDLLLGFFDNEDLPKLSHIRLIKSSAPNRFMILLKFRDKSDVPPFVKKYQGRKFNSFEPETCSVVEVKEIVFRPKPNNDDESMDNIKVALPYLLEDPFTNTDIINETSQQSNKYTELATCPVCLDRLDSSVSGLLTIPCQHTFHCSCLSKWQDDTCPVCRYSSRAKGIDNGITPFTELENTEECVDCGLREHLWMCLICGNIGCGRYDKQHAIKHWEKTGHCFSMETNTQRVWDYVEDNYVHRLVQNEADGKLVELPLRDPSKKTSDEKIEKIGFEYSKLLIGQLESQREYYEDIIQNLNNKISFLMSTNKNLINDTEIKYADIDKKMDKLMKKHDIMEKLTEKYKAKGKEAETLNDAFSEKISVLETENASIKEQNTELQEQVTDLMFFLESQEKFKDASDDVKEGQVLMVPKKTAKKGNKKK